MSNNKKISENLGEKNFEELRSILKKYLPPEMKVYLYGSRAKGSNKKFSDVDLALKGVVNPNNLSEMMLDLEDSDLPFQVDVIQLEKISEDFLGMIERDLREIKF